MYIYCTISVRKKTEVDDFTEIRTRDRQLQSFAYHVKNLGLISVQLCDSSVYARLWDYVIRLIRLQHCNANCKQSMSGVT